MNVSFELQSSMSPKINHKNVYSFPTKTPSVLALKKYFRRSSIMTNKRELKNESVITIKSSSTGSSSESEENENKSAITISDSETSFNYKNSSTKTTPVRKSEVSLVQEESKRTPAQLSEEKYTNIKLWIDDVNKSVKGNNSIFSEASTIYGEDNPCFKAPATKISANSTFAKPDSKRLDELFSSNKNKDDKISSSQITDDATPDDKVIEDSLLTEDNSLEGKCKNLELEDSFELNLDDSLESRLKKRQPEEVTPNNNKCESLEEYEDLLDSLYGDSWREKREEILPSSEPRPNNKTGRTKPKTAPNTEKALPKNVWSQDGPNNLLKTLQKERFKRALESPWVRSLKNICDSDTESEDGNMKLPPIRLNFEDDKENDNKGLISSDTASSSLDNKSKTKSILKTDEKKKKNKLAITNISTNNDGTYSFLASLSKSIPDSKCDMSALVFRNNFKQNREELTRRLFKLYNEQIFDNAIPKDTPLEWNDRMRGTAGFCYCRKITRRTGAVERAARIVLSTKVLDSPDRVRDTLVHEMCHAVTWIVNQVADGHGSLWQSWAHRAMKTFPELPPIKRCHQYVINTKYTYRCVQCGYSIGRHTKSLDTERKRCGHCYGKFEVLINKTTKKGETKTVPATPKKTTGFALFVKENYATYKTPELKHGDVMKLLGQKFSDLKVNPT